ncbi:MAG: hypothetical protein AAF288_04610 [Planctomycetota bacterium]
MNIHSSKRAWGVSLALLSSAGLAGFAAPALGQRVVTAELPAEEEAGKVVEITVDPVAIGPEPLRWELLPLAHEVERGNAALHYGQAALSGLGLTSFWESYAEQIQELNDLPIDELFERVRASDFGDVSQITRDALARNDGVKAVRRAARMSYVDWGLDFSEDPIAVLLPHLGELRGHARLHAHMARWALVQGDFDAAADDLQTMFAMSTQLGRSQPTVLIDALVGVAIATLGQEVLVDWTTRPNAPNLYWAVTDLPNPIIDLREAIRGERSFIFWMFPELTDPEPDLSDVQWIAALDRFFLQGSYPWIAAEFGAPNAEVRMTRAMTVTLAYPHAKWWLQEERGWSAEQAAAISPLEAVARTFRGEFLEARDALMVAMTLPPAEATPWLDGVERNFERLVREPGGPGMKFAGVLLPAVTAANRTMVRSMHRFAQLRTFEAIRHYAALNGGRPPASLEDIDLPIPINPWTGEPFPYRVEEGVAVLGHGMPGRYGPSEREHIYRITFRAPAVSAALIRKESGEPSGRFPNEVDLPTSSLSDG